MATLLLAVTGWDPKGWEARFRALAPQYRFQVWPEQLGDPAEVTYAAVWKPPRKLLAEYPNLKVIFSLGAGVDDLMNDRELPAVPVVRIVDPDLTMRMTEYVTLHVLAYHRRLRLYEAQQRERLWRDHEQPAAREVAVGVMGLGALGSSAAFALQRLGFRVAGWSRSAKLLPGIECFHGGEALAPFLSRTEILVCVLPSTPSTNGILNLKTLGQLKRDGALRGAYLINAGRGALQVEADIVAALDQEILAGATLDVFATEPLPATCLLWLHPKVTVTPHNAAASSPQALVANVLRQIDHCEAGLPLEHVVDRTAGY